MKKVFLLVILVICVCVSAFAATYKINSKGTVLQSPNGSVQTIQANKTTSTTPIQTQNTINTYSVPNYTANVGAYNANTGIVDIIMDYSGSMSQWIDVVENTVLSIVGKLPPNIKLGVRIAGFNTVVKNNTASINNAGSSKYVFKKAKPTIIDRGGSCTSSRVLIPIGDTASVASVIGTVTTGGTTPLIYSIQQAVNKDFASFGYNEFKKIILITDGGENCDDDPCAYARTLAATRPDVTVDVVLVSNDTTLQCLAQTTGGKIYLPTDIYDIPSIITNSTMSTPINTPTNTQPIQTVNPAVKNYEYIPD